MAKLSVRRVGLSGQDPGFNLDGVNPSPSRHEPLFRELLGPWPSPKEAKGLWAAAIFPPTFYLQEPSWARSIPWALTLGSYYGLGEGQGSCASDGRPGELPEGRGGRVSQVGKREGSLQALHQPLLSPLLRPERSDLSGQPLPPPPPPASIHTNIDNS